MVNFLLTNLLVNCLLMLFCLSFIIKFRDMTSQLPTNTFLHDEICDDRTKGKWEEGLIYPPILLAFLSQHDYYMVKIKESYYI